MDVCHTCGLAAIGECMVCSALLCQDHAIQPSQQTELNESLPYAKTVIETPSTASDILVWAGYIGFWHDERVVCAADRLGHAQQARDFYHNYPWPNDPYERALLQFAHGLDHRDLIQGLTTRKLIEGWLRDAPALQIPTRPVTTRELIEEAHYNLMNRRVPEIAEEHTYEGWCFLDRGSIMLPGDQTGYLTAVWVLTDGRVLEGDAVEPYPPEQAVVDSRQLLAVMSFATKHRTKEWVQLRTPPPTRPSLIPSDIGVSFRHIAP